MSSCDERNGCTSHGSTVPVPSAFCAAPDGDAGCSGIEVGTGGFMFPAPADIGPPALIGDSGCGALGGVPAGGGCAFAPGGSAGIGGKGDALCPRFGGVIARPVLPVCGAFIGVGAYDLR